MGISSMTCRRVRPRIALGIWALPPPSRGSRPRGSHGIGAAQRRADRPRRPGLRRPRLLRLHRTSARRTSTAWRSEGVRLTDFYANGPVCTPTRAALMTGRYQQRVGLEWAISPGQKEPGLPALARRRWPACSRTPATRTALFGKWHLGYKPRVRPDRPRLRRVLRLPQRQHRPLLATARSTASPTCTRAPSPSSARATRPT